MRQLVALLALAVLCAPVTGRLQGHLQVGAASSAQAAALRHLKAEATHLAHALQRELPAQGPSISQQEMVAAARQRIAQEALLMGGDRLGSALMSDYAERAPAPLLIFSAPAGLGPEEDDDDMWPVQAAPVPMGAMPANFFGSPGLAPASPAWGPLPSFQSQENQAVSEETVVRSDGRGHMERRTVRCKNGVCEEHDLVSSAPPALDARLGSGNTVAQADATVQEAMRRMAKEMLTVQASLGREGLERAVADLFRSLELAPGSAAAARKVAATTPALVASKTTAVAAAAPVARAPVPQVAAPSVAAEKATVSTQTVVKDGKIVQRVQRCENGKCSTKVISKDAAGAADAKHKAPIIPLLQKRKFRRGKPLASFTHKKN